LSTVACPVGTFNNISSVVNKQESSSCTPCTQGTFQDKEGQQNCKPCNLGRTTQSQGASSLQDCMVEKDTSANATSVPVTIPGKSGKAIAAAIAIPIVVVAIVIITVVLFYRFYKPHLYSAPAKSVKTSTFSVDNPGFQEEHQYSELFAEHHNGKAHTTQRKSPEGEDCNKNDVCLHNADYQPLHVNRRSEPTYAALETESKV